MVGCVSKEDGAEGDDSVGQHAEAEQGEDQQLEAAPLTQKGHLLSIILHGGKVLEAAMAAGVVAVAEIINRGPAGGQTLWREQGQRREVSSGSARHPCSLAQLNQSHTHPHSF